MSVRMASWRCALLGTSTAPSGSRTGEDPPVAYPAAPAAAYPAGAPAGFASLA